MNIREAILKAADQIENKPELFDFQSTRIPGHECGTPGCAVGWIGSFVGLGIEDPVIHRFPLITDVEPAMGVDHMQFYRRMDDLLGDESDWRRDARECARGLRLYADKYHPAPKLGIPNSVRAIFETEQSAAVC